jgi:hypothetical protein
MMRDATRRDRDMFELNCTYEQAAEEQVQWKKSRRLKRNANFKRSRRVNACA